MLIRTVTTTISLAIRASRRRFLEDEVELGSEEQEKMVWGRQRSRIMAVICRIMTMTCRCYTTSSSNSNSDSSEWWALKK